MRLAHISLLAVAILVLAASPAPAADELSGQMASRNFLLAGPWACTSVVPSIMGMPARTDTVTVTFDVAPNNVLHAAIIGPAERGDEYFGYSDRLSNYWTTSANSRGIHGFATSSDGTTYTGTSYLGSGSMDDTSTYTKVSPSQTTMREVLSRGGAASFTIETTCKRSD